MKVFASLIFGLFFYLFCMKALAIESQVARDRGEHAAQLADRFGQVLEESQQEASAVGRLNAGSVDSTQGVSICGNSVLDGGEQCDDGNSSVGDGCSNTCQTEDGYSCTAPVPADLTNRVLDPGFEAGLMGGIWDESSTNFDTPICGEVVCEVPGQRSGSFWVWFGGIDASLEEGRVSQNLVIPASASELRFWLAVPNCASDDDFVRVLIDEVQVWILFGNDAACGSASYVEQVVDISSVADGGSHKLEFHSKIITPPATYTDFFVDDVYLAQGPLTPIPSSCNHLDGPIFGDGFESLP